jgi:hypothetical protein
MITKGEFKLFHIKSIENSADILANEGTDSTCPSWTGSFSLWWTSSSLVFETFSHREQQEPCRHLHHAKHWLRLHIADWLIVLLVEFHSPSHQSGVCERNLY